MSNGSESYQRNVTQIFQLVTYDFVNAPALVLEELDLPALAQMAVAA
jgi:hypothetical protein